MSQARFHFTPFNPVELYDYLGEIASLAEKVGIEYHRTRHAFIVNSHDLETYQITETIAHNRGHSTTLCYDMEQAKNCLRKN